MKQVETKPELSQGGGTGKQRLRHIVQLDDEGRPLDQSLCGYVWDRVFVAHGDSICQKCVDELKRRGRG